MPLALAKPRPGTVPPTPTRGGGAVPARPRTVMLPEYWDESRNRIGATDPALRAAVVEWGRDLRWNAFVSLTTNKPWELQYMRGLLKEWHERVNRKLLGTRWLKKGDCFFICVCFAEDLGVNAHWHGICDLDLVEYSFDDFRDQARKSWRGLVPSADYCSGDDEDIELIGDSMSDRRRVADYMQKQAFNIRSFETLTVEKFNPGR